MRKIEAWWGKATIRIEDDPEGKERPAVVNFVVEQDELRTAGGETVGGLKSWSGEFQASPFPAGLQFAELVLEDGRRGRIFINRIDFTEMSKLGDEWQSLVASASGSFVGYGSAPA